MVILKQLFMHVALTKVVEWVILNYATSHSEPKIATTSHKEPQRPTTSHNQPQRPTTSHSKPYQATTSHNDPPLRHKMNKTHKNLHSLVNALSPLNPLAAGILVKIVFMLATQVRSTRRHLLTPGTHTMFRHYSVCGGSIWKCFCVRNITDLTVIG